jgi:hypothetical protein
MAQHFAMRMLAYGKSQQFDDFSRLATAGHAAAFDTTKAAVARLFGTVAARHAT